MKINNIWNHHLGFNGGMSVFSGEKSGLQSEVKVKNSQVKINIWGELNQPNVQNMEIWYFFLGTPFTKIKYPVLCPVEDANLCQYLLQLLLLDIQLTLPLMPGLPYNW